MAQCPANSGLESLAAEASRRAESMDLLPESASWTEVNRSKSTSCGSGPSGKVRKAYTITKQRERWTDSEHERFLQALKRYGRAWRKIEEHIGTKTAVQIRSHAQKFFSKLQREQSANGGTGDESSKAGISIPPPRPKRKPMHPYPRKNSGDSTTENGSSQQPSQQPSARQTPPSAPSSMPSTTPLPAFPALDVRHRDASLNQILEAAAVAAASAWSQVVAQADCKVQQQLQAHVAAQQGLQNLQPLLNVNPAMLYRLASEHAQQTTAPQPSASNLQSSSQHVVGRSPFFNTSADVVGRTASAALNSQVHGQGQSIQDSPGAGNSGDIAHERDSACSREDGWRHAPLEPAFSTGRQEKQKAWKPTATHAQPTESHLSRAAWDELMAQVQAANAATTSLSDPSRLASTVCHPSRAFSAGPILNNGGVGVQMKQETSKPAARAVKPETGRPGKGENCSQSRSDTSQLANFYQQSAEEAQDRENAENGSSGEGGVSADADGSNGKLGLPHSDKGSNIGATSDEEANVNGSDGAQDPADATGNDGKGSDDGSNSLPGFTRDPSLPAIETTKSMTPTPSRPRTTPVFHQAGKAATAFSAASSQLQAAPALLTEQITRQSQNQVFTLPQQMDALQQQALVAWANSSPQTMQSNYQLLQGFLNSMQAISKGHGAPPPPSPLTASGDISMGERKLSGVPSMDTFHAFSSRSYSMPPGLANESEGGIEAAQGGLAEKEEVSGFKPYNKKHGMPVASLPPAKRFAAGGDRHFVPAPVPGAAQPGNYTSLGSLRQRAG